VWAMDITPLRLSTFEDVLECVVTDVGELVRPDRPFQVADVVAATLEVLTDRLLLFGPWRLDEECHGCERRVGAHTLDGSCPSS
jgi:hypothetical protein